MRDKFNLDGFFREKTPEEYAAWFIHRVTGCSAKGLKVDDIAKSLIDVFADLKEERFHRYREGCNIAMSRLDPGNKDHEKGIQVLRKVKIGTEVGSPATYSVPTPAQRTLGMYT